MVVSDALAAGGAVAVVGDGQLARALRDEVGPRGPGTRALPVLAAIDTTGDLAEIARLLGLVDELGSVVLAGPTASADGTLDLYGDLHLRGLTVVTIPPRADQAPGGR